MQRKKQKLGLRDSQQSSTGWIPSHVTRFIRLGSGSVVNSFTESKSRIGLLHDQEAVSLNLLWLVRIFTQMHFLAPRSFTFKTS